MNIKVISEEIIKPSCPTPSHLRFLPSSLFDQVNSPVLMPGIFFFKSENSSINTKISTRKVLDRLKASLPKTLSVFYPLAGRVQDVNHVNCNDEGIPYVQAKVDKPFKDVIHKADVPELDKLLPKYGQEGFTKLLLAIQVNVFACGGLAIGLLINHAISDGFSFSMFVKTWASMAKGNDCHLLLGRPNFDIWKQFPPKKTTNKDDIVADPNPNLIKDRPIAKWFMFRKTNLDALKRLMLSYNKNKSKNNTTTNPNVSPSLAIVLSSFIWSRIKATCLNNNNNNVIFQAVNLRPRVTKCSGDESYYFGNMFANALVRPSGLVLDDDDDNSSSDGNDILTEITESISMIISDDGFVRKLQEGKQDLSYMRDVFERESRGELVLHGFSNLRSLDMYDTDFGWGKPVWVTSATLIFKNLVILIPADPTGKDIVAYINLIAEDMAKLEGDADFNAFLSKAPRITSKL